VQRGGGPASPGAEGSLGTRGGSVRDGGSSGCSGFHRLSAGTRGAAKENELRFVVGRLKKFGDGAPWYRALQSVTQQREGLERRGAIPRFLRYRFSPSRHPSMAVPLPKRIFKPAFPERPSLSSRPRTHRGRPARSRSAAGPGIWGGRVLDEKGAAA